MVSLNPAQIKNFWIGLPLGTNKIDAVYERKSDNRIIFFIGERQNPVFVCGFGEYNFDKGNFEWL